ncbi:ECH1 protein, partial [Eudromia elegans]|nr:ECH1 protein [Eudromia elegans]
MAPGGPQRAGAHTYETLRVSAPRQHVLHVELHRPHKRNALNVACWREMVQCFQGIARDPDCRAVVLSGAGKLFSAGIDLQDIGEVLVLQGDDTARKAWNLQQTIRDFQESFTVLEKCPKPVIVAVHGACIGAGEQ